MCYTFFMPTKRVKKLPEGMQEASCGAFSWINIVDVSKEHLIALKSRFDFLRAPDLKELLPPFQRPKLLDREDYLFIVLLFPVFDEDTNRITPTEIDFLVGPDFLVTNHTGELEKLQEIHESASKVCQAVGKNSPELLLFHIIKTLHAACYPILTRITNTIIELEHDNLAEIDEPKLRELLKLKSQIVDLKNIMQGHRQVVKKLEDHASHFFPMPDNNLIDYPGLIENIGEIESFIDNDRDTVNALYDSAFSLMQFRTSEATKSLSAMALIIFPTTLVAAIFSMRPEHMPFVNHDYGFWIVLSFVFIVMIGTIVYIKSKRWL